MRSKDKLITYGYSLPYTIHRSQLKKKEILMKKNCLNVCKYKWDYFIPHVCFIWMFLLYSIRSGFFRKKYFPKIKCDVFMTPCMFVTIFSSPLHLCLIIVLTFNVIKMFRDIRNEHQKKKKKIAVACVEHWWRGVHTVDHCWFEDVRGFFWTVSGGHISIEKLTR